MRYHFDLIVMQVRFYIGYFGAGFLVASLLAICSIENANQIRGKAAATGVAAVFFLISVQALRRHCFIMMVRAVGGDYLGSHISRRLDPRFMRGTGGLYRLGRGCLFLVRAELK
jgi:uncharacterized membrane protein YfcA